MESAKTFQQMWIFWQYGDYMLSRLLRMSAAAPPPEHRVVTELNMLLARALAIFHSMDNP